MYDILKRMERRIANIIKWYFLKKKLKRHIRNDELGIVCSHPGIGDVYLLGALYEALLKKYKAKKIKFFITNNRKEILEIFNIKDIIIVDNIHLAQSNKFLSTFLLAYFFKKRQKIKLGNIITNPIDLLRLEIKNQKNKILFSNVFKNQLNLPTDTIFNTPKIPKKYYISARKLLKSKTNNQNKKIIILSPDAVFASKLPINFWEELERKIKKNGFQVLYNSKNAKLINKSIYFSLGEAIPISEMIEGIISIRSGLCDLLSTSKTKLVIIYPEMKWINSNSLYDSFNLKDMGLNNNALEIIYNEKDQNNIIHQILNFLK